MREEKSVSAELVIRNPIKAAVSLSRTASREEIKNNSLECEKAAGVLARIEQLQSTLLPVERGILPVIRSKKKEAANKVQQLESLDKLNQYAVFSLEPLTWRNKQGYPRLAVFSLESPNLELAVIGKYSSDGWYDRRRWTKKIEPKLPQEIMECYKDVLDRLAETAKKTKKTIRLRAKFAMLIPPTVKEKIIQARGEFKEIFIVAETPQWDIKETVIPRPNKDPLVVGYDGVNYWLIAVFDPTPLEEYIANEKYFDTKGPLQ